VPLTVTGIEIADDAMWSASAEIIRKQASPIDIGIDSFQNLVDRFLLSAIQRWLLHVIIKGIPFPKPDRTEAARGSPLQAKTRNVKVFSDWILKL
jgi:hypothetical protein